MIFIESHKFVLSNGLEVVLHEDHSLPFVAVNVWYHVGSKDEEVGRTGFAHLFEHVMFEGSKHHNRDYFEPLQKVGATLNGSTAADRTNYWENVPSNCLELALWLESDRMGYLLDALDQTRFDIQREVVKNERRQSYDNRPYGRSQLLLHSATFPPPHPYSWPVIGSQEDLDSASLDDVKNFFRRFYSPSNASLSIAGDFDSDQVTRLVDLYFSGIPSGPPIDRISRLESSLKGETSITIRDKVQLPRLYLVWPVCPMFDASEAPLDILAAVMGDGKSSRLYRSLVYEKQIVSDVSVDSYSQEIGGEFRVQVTASPGHTLEEGQKVVEEEFDRICRIPPTEEEVRRAKNRIEIQHLRQLERFGGFAGRADQLNYYNVFAKNPGLINTDLERYMVVSPDQVSRTAQEFLSTNRVKMSVLPESTTKHSTRTVDRSVMPKSLASSKFDLPVAVRHQFENKLSLIHVAKPGIPLVAAGMIFRTGAIKDPVDRPGLSHMTAAMLLEGTTDRSSQQISEEMEFLGAQLDLEAAREHVFSSVVTLTTHWRKALNIMADAGRNSTFPARELERVRNERLADLKRVADDSNLIAQRASRSIIYGPEGGYGHPLTGTEQSVSQMTREELMSLYEGQYTPDRATVVVVGDVSTDEAVSAVGNAFGDWSCEPTAGDDGATIGNRQSQAETTIYLVDKPGAAQSVICVGHLTIPHRSPDYYALSLLNYVFGGSPVSRLFMNLRQDKGYSYGYYSTIDWVTGPSAILAGGSVETRVTKEAVAETLKEFADIHMGRPVTKDEYNAAREGIFKHFPSQFETQAQVLQQFSGLVAFGLPDDYYSNYIDNMNSVTLDDVHRVGAERIDDKHLTVLVVGDRESVQKGLCELGFRLVVVDSDGRPLA